MGSKKKVIVDRKFINDLARSIYDSKSHRFLRLCDGKLQNGPDPKDSSRPMHCGLGELYYAMTGRQPKEDHMTEADVVNLAVELSPLNNLVKDARERAKEGIKKLNLPKALERELLDNAKSMSDEDIDERESCFRNELDAIPDANDEYICGLDEQVYKERAKRVAKQLREAAKYLPK